MLSRLICRLLSGSDLGLSSLQPIP
jgi:hypothetical protein